MRTVERDAGSLLLGFVDARRAVTEFNEFLQVFIIDQSRHQLCPLAKRGQVYTGLTTLPAV